jgi:hypothetical protein
MHIPKMKVQEKMRDALTLGFPPQYQFWDMHSFVLIGGKQV